MSDWFNFALSAVSRLVTTIFGLSTGLGFSLGDFIVAVFVLGVIASAFVIGVSKK